MFTNIPASLLVMLSGLLITMTCGTVIRLLALRGADPELRRKRLSSLRTWWGLALVLSFSIALGRTGVCLLLCLLSCLGMREFATLVGRSAKVSRVLWIVCGIAVANYALILMAHRNAFVAFFPIAALLGIPVARLLQRGHEDYIRSVGGLLLGGLSVVYGLSHAAYLYILPETSVGPVGPAGWFLFLIILTESNDIAQALVGRRFGAHKRHRLAPAISPNKTWEGLIGGMLVTVALAVGLSPWLTDLHGATFEEAIIPQALLPALLGILVCVFGYFGDINMSAVKRDAGVKDSSNLLPGMGGVIDRIDSLSLTAPAFVYFLILIS